jgi:SAM-dependent methyltransferase
MIDKIIKTLQKVRAVIMKRLRPVDAYFLSKSLQPISTRYGFDRGTPIDRVYIDQFLSENSNLITGRCLEVVDPTYINKFGTNVTHPEVIDNDAKSKIATIIADLRDMKGVDSNSFDCVLITHTFGMIYDYEVAIKECHRILKPGGHLLVTMSCFSPIYTNDDANFWRFTPASAKRAFGKFFTDFIVKTYGNCLTGYSFWVGMAAEELESKALKFNDPRFPLIVTVKARKGKK